ncbi:conserved hypothetical protein [Theileria orientalis strain Shintoku]|uniref:Ubiquitin-like domain-containing protein n=1 Tax=Theileria orientalis strain Shintoku TaxID=869250 RepID=J4C881_THEOR|nr:conserved hypothetical protein [Theileria orientalis strain Shintoku]BAM40328.1 conserved hypothetical protein [Theileria orientalis strain Shintoku]|eukprot:XP_009690629.1 conserved hypothetical protein [Theileria orientalis strain Shintoku]
MSEFSVGDRVEVSDLLGTIVSTGDSSSENGNKTHNWTNLPDGYTLVVEWDNLTKGDFDHHSNRLNKLKNNKLAILNHISSTTLRNGLMSTDTVHSDVYRILNERFLALDAYKPCSFVKLDNINFGTSFEEAFKAKYLYENENVHDINLDDSGHVYEFVGIDSAVDFFSDVSKLFIVDLNGMKISKLGRIEQFPKCSELYINNNLLDSSKINELLENFPKLQVLDISSNKIDLPIGSDSISTLVMNNCYFEFKTVLETLDKSKNIQNLVMCNNLLSEIEYLGNQYPMIKAVDLSSNYIYKWDTIKFLLELFPNLGKLALENNYISTVESSEHLRFLNPLELDLSNNLIEDLNELVKISQIFPNLTKLKVNYNPINPVYMGNSSESTDSRFSNLVNKLNNTNDTRNTNSSSKELVRMFIIVTFPNLNVLNGTIITHQERANFERYVNNLSDKPDPIISNTISTNNKIKVKLFPDGDSESFKYNPVEKNLMESYTVLELKLLCSSLFNMNLKDIKLIYNSKTMPLSEELDDDSADLRSYGISDGYQIRVQNKRLMF